MALIRIPTILGTAAIALSSPALAQNTAGVPGPVVREGRNYAEYRITYGLRDEAAGDVWAQRVHYDNAPTENLMWRIVAQVRDSSGGGELDHLKGELFHEVRGPEAAWRTGFRYDLLVRGDGPQQVAALWLNEFALSDKVAARAVLVPTYQFGKGRRGGVGVETRFNLTYRSENGVRFGVESYNRHGTTENLEILGDRTQIGPFAFWPVGRRWQLFTGALLADPGDDNDVDLRFWAGRIF